MFTINDREESHRRYRELQKLRPDLFRSTDAAKYITDEDEINRYEDETGERLGVLYQAKNYERFVVDLVERDGKRFPHGRAILPDNGVIIVPRLGDRFILEDQYRYPVCGKHLAFPRGHCEAGSTPEEDAAREIEEELGGAKLKSPVYIGKTYPETHSMASFCSVFEGEVEGVTFENGVLKRDGYEGIENLVLLSRDEIDFLIRTGKIDCGYTLAAWALYKAHDND